MGVPIQVVFDCSNPDALANFWAEVLRYEKQKPPEGYASWEDVLQEMGVPEEEWDRASAVVDPEGVRPRIYFQKVPEPKTSKNRVHLDVNAVGRADISTEERQERVNAEVDRVVALGAKRLRLVEQQGEYTAVMQDPEGNEFCIQ